jgi:hypothetical protein
MAKKKATSSKRFKVLINCSNKAGKDFEPGDVVTVKEFPVKVIENWLAIDPPVLEEVV